MQIRIFHTNDIHSDYAFLERVYGYLKEHRREADLYLDSGDFMDLKSPVVQADRGKTALSLLAACDADALALGNNEIDLGSEDVAALNGMPLLSANVTDKDGNTLKGATGSCILNRGGCRILIIGLSPYYSAEMKPDAYNLFFEMGNIRTTEPLAAVEAELNAHKGAYDYVIALSHSGHVADTALKEKLPQVNLWLGGHTHKTITEPDYSMSGKGESLGCVTLEVDGGKVYTVDSVQLTPETESEEFRKLLKEAEAYADKILSKELEIAEELEFDPFRESRLLNYLCDCLHKQFGGDLAIMHGGIAEKSLMRPVSRKSLLEIFPSKLNPTWYRISGKKIMEAVRQSLDEEYIRQSGKGAGFRGSVLGCLGFSANVRVQKEPFAMWIDGNKVEEEKTYTIVTDDYLQRGTGYPSLEVPDEEASFDKWFIRDLVEHCLKDKELFETAQIRRFSARWGQQSAE